MPQSNLKSDEQPQAYKQGFIEWYKLKFKVTEDVLIPRPETELFVDEILSYLNNNPLKQPTILDIGTGCGAIAIAVAKNLPNIDNNVKIIATEVSESALKVAIQNAKFHGVEDQITFVLSDLLQNIDLTQVCQSLQDVIIVTNLPYIPSARIPYLESSVKDFEPHIALDGGEDGFELYRKLFQQINQQNCKPKLILGEIDYTHGELAANEAYKYFKDAQIEVKKDLAHLQRVLYIKS